MSVAHELDILLADMRRKYLEASRVRTPEQQAKWIAGGPMTKEILEDWIARLERIKRLTDKVF